MIALPPVDVRPIDIEIQVPNANADALCAVVSDLFGVQLDEQSRILTISPHFPSTWKGEDVALSMEDFDFSCTWCDSICTWDFSGFGMFAESYDSIVVHAPVGTLMTGELASEGVCILYVDASAAAPEPLPVVELSRKERKALEKRQKALLKEQKKALSRKQK